MLFGRRDKQKLHHLFTSFHESRFGMRITRLSVA